VLAKKAQFTPQEQQATICSAQGAMQRMSPRRRARRGPAIPQTLPPAISYSRQPELPYYGEDRPDALGYVANPAGSSFVDGVSVLFSAADICSASLGGRKRDGSSWRRTTRRDAVPTLRNVDKRPDPAFVEGLRA